MSEFPIVPTIPFPPRSLWDPAMIEAIKASRVMREILPAITMDTQEEQDEFMLATSHLEPFYEAMDALARWMADKTFQARRLAIQRHYGKNTVIIDPNVRVENNWTYTGLTEREITLHVSRFSVGTKVIAIEIETGMHWEATVKRVDFEARLIYLEIEWAKDLPWSRMDP